MDSCITTTSHTITEDTDEEEEGICCLLPEDSCGGRGGRKDVPRSNQSVSIFKSGQSARPKNNQGLGRLRLEIVWPLFDQVRV